MKTLAASTSDHDHDYSGLLIAVNASFSRVASGKVALFCTDADGLNELYLDSLPSERQVHTCYCCKRFIGTYGKLVTIEPDGSLRSVMWGAEDVPEFYRSAFDALRERVERSRVTGVFLSKEKTWGNPATGSWEHMAVQPPASFVFRERALTAGQAMAATRENYRTVATALADFTAPMLDQALRMFEGDALARSEKFIGPAKWLRALQDRPKGRKGENALWAAIASAPEGYCHPRASVLGPLLDDIVAGLPFEDIKARFNAKLGPLIYQRPQAAPSAGNIKAAEELVAKLGIAPSLERRFARLEDLQQIVWAPKLQVDSAALAGGVFGHIKPKSGRDAVQAVDLPAQTMTWDKFARTVLPTAEQMEIRVPSNGRFIALTTAAHEDAPPVLRWDSEDARNPVAWYVYPNASVASQWKLTANTWARVSAATPFPPMWGAHPKPHLGDGIILVIEGCADTRTGSGNALFPECLRDDLHGARSTIEAYSRSAELVGRDEASACGYDIRKAAANCKLRVFSNGAWAAYDIDRWD